jgi:hypothetical protein
VPSGATPTGTPDVPLGTLEFVTPSRTFRYAFTRDDLIWTAKLVVHEAGGDEDAENAAVIWAMFNRYALFTYRYYSSFTAFIRRYSTTLQPVLANPRAAARHYQKGDAVYRKTGGFYEGTQIPKGQLVRHLQIQAAPWSAIKESARRLAVRAMRGELPNPGIGLASEFASTYVFFRQRYGRNPSRPEWLAYTQRLAQAKKWSFVGDVQGIDPTKNAFFVQNSVRSLPSDAVRVAPPATAPEMEFQSESGESFEGQFGGPSESFGAAFEDEEYGEEFGEGYAEQLSADPVAAEQFDPEGLAAEQFNGEGIGEEELGESFVDAPAAEAFAAEEERGLYEALET